MLDNSSHLAIKMLRSGGSGSHLVPPEYEPTQQVGRQAELGSAVSIQSASNERFSSAPCARPVPARRLVRHRGRLPSAPAAIHYSSRMLKSWIGGQGGEEEENLVITLDRIVPNFFSLSPEKNI